MSTAANKLMRFLPPVLALAALGGACLWEVDRVAARSRGYGDKRVVINELCAHNLSGLQDGNGNCGTGSSCTTPAAAPSTCRAGR